MCARACVLCGVVHLTTTRACCCDTVTRVCICTYVHVRGCCRFTSGLLQHLAAPGQTVYTSLPHIQRHVRGLAGRQRVFIAGHPTVGHVVLRGGSGGGSTDPDTSTAAV